MKPEEIGIRLGTAAVRLYQVTLGPWLGGRCRFYPSCSNYALEAIREHGLFRGSWLALKRVGRCHPLHAGGVDLVPPRACGYRHAGAGRS